MSLILPSKLCKRKGRRRGRRKVDGTRARRRRERERERTGCLNFYRPRMFEMAEWRKSSCVRTCLFHLRVFPLWPAVPFRHGNPSGPCSTRVEENVNSEKENTRITRRILPTFFRRVKFLFSLPLLSILFLTRRYRYNYLVRERLYPFFVPKGKAGRFSSFLFFLPT